MKPGICIKILVVTMAISAEHTGFAKSPDEKGREIVIEADRRDLGFKDSQAHMRMILKNRRGDISERHIRVKTLEVQDDGDKSLIIFDSPKDVRGTGFLSFTHALDADDQWLYLPALKRVKRIASNNKSGPFMGSEFSYEDLTSVEIPKYKYKYLRDEDVNGLDCFVVEFTPQYKYSGYTKQIVWIDKANYRVQKVDYYDRKNSLLKTQTFFEYALYLGRYWRALRMLMVNHQSGKTTELRWKNYEFRNGYNDRDFDRSALKRLQ